MIKEVIYNPDFIETVHTLSGISEQLLFNREIDETTNKEVVALRIRSETLIYTLKAPIEYFDFGADVLAFFDFNKFYNVYRFSVTTNENKELVAPVIKAEIDDEENSMTNGEVTMLVIESSRNGNNRTINHRISTPDVIDKPNFKNIKFKNNTNCEFNLSKENLDTLKKMASLNTSDEIIFSGEGDSLKVDFRSSKVMDTMNEVYKTNCDSNPFSLKVGADGLQKIPSGDYTTEYMENSLIKFHQNRNDEIDLNLYILRKKV